MGCDNQGNVCRDKASVEDCAYQGSDLEHALLFQSLFRAVLGLVQEVGACRN